MKKIIALLLALVLCCGVFAGCNNQTATGPSDGKTGATIEDALAYLKSSYKNDEGKKTSADYKMPAQIDIEGVKFTITWTSDNEAIKFVLEDGLYVVDVPTKNETEVTYKLTATIKDAAGKTATAEFSRVLPVYDDGASVTKPVEGQAYKLFFIQSNLGKTLYCIGEAQNDKFIMTDVDPKKGADFYAEEVEGGYKFYTTINGEKMYLHAFTVTGDDDKISKHISFAAESDVVYYYKTEVKTWFVKINNIEYGIGTYNEYATMSISEGTYFTSDKVGVTQFCMTLITKEAAEEQEVSTGPADPTELSTITELAEKAGALADGTQTAEKYLVKGTVVEIVNDQYGNIYIEDEAGNKLYVYGTYSKDGSTRFDAMDPQPKVGDTVTLMGVLSNYKGDGQMKNGWVQELVPGAGTENPVDPEPTDPEPTDPEPTDPVTPSGIDKISDAVAASSGKFTVEGVVTCIDGKNIYIMDSTGAICVRGSENATVKLGDIVKGTGDRETYNGLPQLNNATYEKTGTGTLTAKSTTISALTAADVCFYVVLENVEVTEVFDNNGEYSNPNVTITDASGKTIQIYKAVVPAGLKAGDVITVKCAVSVYGDKLQLRNSDASEIIVH